MTVLSVKKSGGDRNQTWDIQTDLNPAMLTIVGLSMFKKWVEFAMGKTSLGGKMLMHPTGRYASHIRFAQTGVASVAIMAMEGPGVPEASILETGHKRIDLKQYFSKGRVIPMHRGAEGDYGSVGYGPAHNAFNIDRSASANKGQMTRGAKIWAKARAQGASGYARIGDDPDSWIIPPMAPYSPAAQLVALLQQGAPE